MIEDKGKFLGSASNNSLNLRSCIYSPPFPKIFPLHHTRDSQESRDFFRMIVLWWFKERFVRVWKFIRASTGSPMPVKGMRPCTISRIIAFAVLAFLGVGSATPSCWIQAESLVGAGIGSSVSRAASLHVRRGRIKNAFRARRVNGRTPGCQDTRESWAFLKPVRKWNAEFRNIG